MLRLLAFVSISLSSLEFYCANTSPPVLQTRNDSKIATHATVNISISTATINDTTNSSIVELKTNHRFDRYYIATKDKDLTLLISITSGPNPHLRDAAR